MNAKTMKVIVLLALASGCFAADKTSPIAIDCTFYGNVDFKKLNFRGFSNTKVAPENIIFWRPDSLPRNDKPHYPNYWELGRGFGHITGTVDFREIGPKLRTLASAYIFKFASGPKDLKPSR